MGNNTNDRNWAAMERLRFIEACAWWRGIVQRQDLVEVFGVSMAQASSDLQRYLEINPAAFVYNLRKKRYETMAEMKCILTVPNLDEAVSRFLGGAQGASIHAQDANTNRVAVLPMPVRRASIEVERRVFLAILNGFRVRMLYASVNSSKEDWRWILPHALGHNGARWHVRAWCEVNGEFRDFTLSRIAEIEWSRETAALPARDEDWETMVTLEVTANSKLTAEQRMTVERDYAMTDGVLRITVRRAMEGYLRDRLGIAMADGKLPVSLLE